MTHPKTALLLIDVQTAMFSPTDPVHNGDNLLTTLQHLIRHARTTRTPVIYIQHNEGPGAPLEPGTTGWTIHEAITPSEGDIVIQKHHPDSFHDTNLQQTLTTLGIEHLILTGIQTEICVDTTCRRAVSLGYQVTLVQDAHSTWRNNILTADQIIQHHNSTLRWFANIVTSDQITTAKN